MTDTNKEMESIFKESWKRTERFYMPKWSSQEWIRPVLHFLLDLREKRYNTKFYVGQSMWTLILSRAKRRRPLGISSHIRFSPRHQGSMEVRVRNMGEAIRFEQEAIEVTPQIEQLLDNLCQKPIE